MKSPESVVYRRGLGIFLTETPTTDAPNPRLRPLFPPQPHFPALRSGPAALSGASRRKQNPCSDGTDISALSKSSLREKLAYVTQEPFLFNGTVRENLLLARRDAGDADLWAALTAAHAENFVRELPEQLDTNVGERGVKLSGGEKQRLSIARALLKDAPILLLDEATASVDSETERLIQDALDHLMSNRTAFVIAHRLSTIQKADCIYVLEKGQVIEQGTHAELLARGGKYTELCRKSFLSPDEVVIS